VLAQEELFLYLLRDALVQGDSQPLGGNKSSPTIFEGLLAQPIGVRPLNFGLDSMPRGRASSATPNPRPVQR
jgi:hypothetical protein